MTKIEFIKFLIDNNYRYYESKKEINVEEIIDELGNVDRVYSFDKETKEFSLCKDRDINDKNATNDCYVLRELDLKILKYFVDLLEKGKEE